MPKGEEHGDSNSRYYTVIRGRGYAETRARDERANGVPCPRIPVLPLFPPLSHVA